MKVSYEQLKSAIKNALINNNVNEDKAEIMATVHTDSTLKGVNSHGINRIPRLIDFIKRDLINVDSEMTLIKSIGAIESYDGNLGFGVINALEASDRVCELASQNGIAMVTLKNTTHRMRGGTYGERIANNGFVGMAWTNTESLMPAWSSDEISIGNNPIAIGIPSDSGNLLLDMAISQYSYGKLQTTRLNGEKLPYPGGFDIEGNLTDDPKKIEDSKRLLPIGYWKGSGLAIVLDTMAALLSTGKSTNQLDEENVFNCTGCSQIFIAMNPEAFSTKEQNEKLIFDIKNSIEKSHPINPESKPRYPGAGIAYKEKQGLKEGIEIDEEIFNEILKL